VLQVEYDPNVITDLLGGLRGTSPVYGLYSNSKGRESSGDRSGKGRGNQKKGRGARASSAGGIADEETSILVGRRLRGER